MKKIWGFIFAMGIVASSVVGVTYGFVEDTQELNGAVAQADENDNTVPEVYQCEIVDGTYYGKEGNKVSAEIYDMECVEHKCEIVAGIYFGKDGVSVDKETYQIECQTNICKKVGEKYFGKDGKEVNEATYNSQCNAVTYNCEYVNGVYYNKAGNAVTKAQYEANCLSSVTPPETGVGFSVTPIILIGIIAIVISKMLKNKLYRV